MAENAELVCDEEFVRLLYYVALGREPESNDIWLGAPVAEAVSVIIASEEFRAIANACLDLTFPKPQLQKSQAARSTVADVLTRYGAPRPRTNNWYDLLLSGLIWFNSMLPENSVIEITDPVIAAISSEFRETIEAEDILADVLRFDPQWFIAANRNAIGLDRLSNADLLCYAEQATRNGNAELFPFFTIRGEENSRIRRDIFEDVRENSISLLIGNIRNAVTKRQLGHWLFDEEYYLASRQQYFADNPHHCWEPLEHPYLDFIAFGDAKRVRAHPLFCPIAYEALNSEVKGEVRAFSHYLKVGQFRELRTHALFDPTFYTALNPSASIDIAGGRFTSALESFCREGASKRYPFSPDFDEGYYWANNAEIVKADQSGPLSSIWHFLRKGAAAGLQSNPYFDPEYYVRRYPAVAARCRELAISPLEHFLLFGKEAGLRPGEPLSDREVDVLQAKAIYERRALDSLTRISRRPLDFSAFAGPDPILSVIVPVHNQVSFTARFLELAYHACAELKRRAGRSSQIIVVSNGSSDRTDEMLATMGGLTVLASGEALGFTRAANQGAAAASGDYLLVVNNDIEFDPGVFADLVDSFRETPNCGAMGARILSMDMTVQEIGSFVARDGSTGGHARGSRSSHHPARQKREVDYVSGCFLCLERADFERLDGFDEAFSPGYYEEVDLCQRIVAELGKAVLVDTALTVLHYENASFTQGRPTAVLYPLILRNRQRFMRKHPALVERRSAPIRRGARPGHGTKILVIVDMIPDARLGCNPERMSGILSVIHDLGVEYDILALKPTMEIDDYEFPDVALYRAWMPQESVDEVLDHEIDSYSHIWVDTARSMRDLADRLQVYKDRHQTTIICNADATAARRIIETARIDGEPHSNDDAIALIGAELSQASVADHFVTANEQDAELVRSAGGSPVSVVAYGRPAPSRSAKNWQGRAGLLLVGERNSAFPLNFDLIHWLAQSVLPKIAHLGLTLKIVGFGEEEGLQRCFENYPFKDVEFHGVMSDDALVERFDDALLVLSPNRIPSGLRCRVIDAMATGVPVVMSTPVADEFSLAAGEAASLAVASVDDDGVSFANEITRLTSDQEYWASVKDAQLSIAANRYSRESLTRQVSLLLQDVGVSFEGSEIA